MRTRRSFAAALCALALAFACSLGPRPPLSEQVLPLPTRVYGRSLTLEVGKPASLARIEKHLRAAGYQAAKAEPKAGEFRAAKGAFSLRARRLAYPGAPAPEALIAGRCTRAARSPRSR